MLNLLVEATLQGFVVADDAQETSDRDMAMDKCLSLVALHFSKVIRITLEVSTLQNTPIDFVQLRERAVVAGPLGIGMVDGLISSDGV